MQNKSPTYKIRQVIDLTGASEFLLRTWELRYSALEPVRTKTGRRLYTENDILKARALVALTGLGYRVSQIAHKSVNELNQLLGQSAIETEVAGDPLVEKIFTKAAAFKWAEVRELLLDKRQPLTWIHDVIVPVLMEMGQRVNSRSFSIAQEHILSALIKECLAARMNRAAPLKSAPRLVFAAPEGDHHDLGLQIAAFIAAELRVNTLFVGAHMPKDELAAVCVRYSATHLLLSSTVKPGEKNDLLKYLHFLDRNLATKTTIWLAGQNAMNYSLSLKRPFKILPSFAAFESELKAAR